MRGEKRLKEPNSCSIMRKLKRGQLTIFVVIAVAVIFGILMITAVRSNVNPVEIFIKPDSVGVKERVESCIVNSTLDSVYFLGLQGGYFYNIPDDTENYGDLYIPVYLSDSNIVMPSEKTLEYELNLAIKEILKTCVGKFNETDSQGYTVTVGDVKSVKTKINESIYVEVNFPITMTKGTNTKTLASYSKTVDFNFKDKYFLVEQFVREQQKDMATIPAGYMADLAKNNNFKIESINTGNGTELYSFIFPEKHLGMNYSYNFFVRYPNE